LPYFIESYCAISNGKIAKNGDLIFSSKQADFSQFMKEAYHNFNTAYPRFFKMDGLSKLAFLSSEIILENQSSKNIGIVICNSASSLDTDRKHSETIINSNYRHANPSVFVYTLPNICIGEISIRNKLHTESAFFVMEHFNAVALFNYADSLLNSNTCEKILCGWVEVDNNKYESLLYLVSKEGIILHTPNEIKNIYEHAAR